jgi:hypothetical protein
MYTARGASMPHCKPRSTPKRCRAWAYATWIDPARRVAGTIMTQILPFADARALALAGRFERGIYRMPGVAGRTSEGERL